MNKNAGAGENKLAPPTFGFNNPLECNAMSRTISPSTRKRDARANKRLYGSFVSNSGVTFDDWRYVAEVTIRRCSSLMLQPRSMNSTESQSRSSGCDGFSLCVPKSSLVETIPVPKYACQ